MRAATTAAVALARGASAVWPVATVEEARLRAAELPHALLGGERSMRPPEGFDLGNSPREYTEERVHGRPIVLSTTNGTLALSKGGGAIGVAFACLSTAHLAADWIRRGGGDAIIVMAGTNGHFAHEDALTAGAIADRLEGMALDDLLLTARAAFRGARERLAEEFATTPHGARLVMAGFASDVSFCARPHALPILPVRDATEPRRLVAWRG